MLPPIFTFVDWQREPWHLVEWPLRPTLTFLGFAPNLFSHIEEGGQPWTEIHTFYPLRNSQRRIPLAVLAPIIMYIEDGETLVAFVLSFSIYILGSGQFKTLRMHIWKYSIFFSFCIHPFFNSCEYKTLNKACSKSALGFCSWRERDLYGSFNFNWILTPVAQFNIAQFLTLFFWGNFK